MSRPWSLRRRLAVVSFFWTLLLLSIVLFASFAAAHAHIGFMSVAHFGMVASLCTLGALAGLAQLRLGLAPFERLRAQLEAVRDGREPMVTGEYPAEVQPLVDELNRLLAQREEAIRRAQVKAADLAHGLKTPLAVVAQEAGRAAAAGAGEFAGVVGHEVERMRRQVDYHLAQARAAASGAAPGVRVVVRASVDGLVRTLERLYVDRGLTITVEAPADLAVRSQREDLDEMLGNLVDNACKWARQAVWLSATAEGGQVVIAVEDDGPGLEASLRQAVLDRGVRNDEAAPGTGIGLAIVRDLSGLYGGSITLGASPRGGLRAELRLPSGRAATSSAS